MLHLLKVKKNIWKEAWYNLEKNEFETPRCGHCFKLSTCYFQLASGKLCPAQLEIPHVDK